MLPSFSEDDKRDFRRLGLCVEQVEELRFAVNWVKLWIRPPVAKNKIKAHLTEIQAAAKALYEKLDLPAVGASSGHQQALELLDERAVIIDPGAEDALHPVALLPHLATLLDVTDYALDQLAKQGPARYRTGDPRPIKRIEVALLDGWARAHGSIGIHVRCRALGTGDPEADDAAMDAAIVQKLDEGAKAKPSNPYPKKLLPSGDAFKDVVRLVYAAAKYNKDPKRAIENFVAEWNAEREGAVAAMTAGLEELRRQQQGV